MNSTRLSQLAVNEREARKILKQNREAQIKRAELESWLQENLVFCDTPEDEAEVYRQYRELRRELKRR